MMVTMMATTTTATSCHNEYEFKFNERNARIYGMALSFAWFRLAASATPEEQEGTEEQKSERLIEWVRSMDSVK